MVVLPSRLRLSMKAGRFLLLLLLAAPLISGCEYISSALPPTPSPFPTLARLPTVTPEPPSPTPAPTFTPVPLRPTPTPSPPSGTVTVGSNVRAGPGLDYTVVAGVEQGKKVQLLGTHQGWYKIITPDEVEGWISGELLSINPAVATEVPAIEP